MDTFEFYKYIEKTYANESMGEWFKMLPGECWEEDYNNATIIKMDDWE